MHGGTSGAYAASFDVLDGELSSLGQSVRWMLDRSTLR